MDFCFSWNVSSGHGATLDRGLRVGLGHTEGQHRYSRYPGCLGAAGGCVCTLHPLRPHPTRHQQGWGRRSLRWRRIQFQHLIFLIILDFSPPCYSV